MATIEQLRAEVGILRQAVNDDQASDAQVVRDLQAEIDRLLALGGAATEEQLDEIANALQEIAADVAGPNEVVE